MAQPMIDKQLGRSLRSAMNNLMELEKALALDDDTRRKRYGEQSCRLLAQEASVDLCMVKSRLGFYKLIDPLV